MNSKYILKRNVLKKLLFFAAFILCFKTNAQTRAIYIVENYYYDGVLQKGKLAAHGVELSISRKLDDSFYFFTNEWTEEGSYSTGKIIGWHEVDKEIAFDFDINQDDDLIHAYEFKWKFENSYDNVVGKADVLFIEYGDECDRFFTCIVNVASQELELKYEGYKE